MRKDMSYFILVVFASFLLLTNVACSIQPPANQFVKFGQMTEVLTPSVWITPQKDTLYLGSGMQILRSTNKGVLLTPTATGFKIMMEHRRQMSEPPVAFVYTKERITNEDLQGSIFFYYVGSYQYTDTQRIYAFRIWDFTDTKNKEHQRRIQEIEAREQRRN